jgi:D-serine dehydratase
MRDKSSCNFLLLLKTGCHVSIEGSNKTVGGALIVLFMLELLAF